MQNIPNIGIPSMESLPQLSMANNIGSSMNMGITSGAQGNLGQNMNNYWMLNGMQGISPLTGMQGVPQMGVMPHHIPMQLPPQTLPNNLPASHTIPNSHHSLSEGGRMPSMTGGKNGKKKRRSKFDQMGRSYTCGCGKRYLSYPALYTHIKTKHSGRHPPGTNTPRFYNGNPRGRGRPKKGDSDEELSEGDEDLNLHVDPPPYPNNNWHSIITGAQEESKRQSELSKTNTERLPLPVAPTPIQRPNSIGGESTYEFLERLGVVGGPTAPDTGFEELIETKDEGNKAIYIILKQEVDTIMEEMREAEQGKVVPPIPPHMKCCDRILGEFLIQMSKRVNSQFYKTLLLFILHYRSCMNQKVYSIHNESVGGKLQPLQGEYTTQYNAEYMPEVSNHFIKNYLPANCRNFELNVAIKLTMFICEWLHLNHFTKCKLSLLSL